MSQRPPKTKTADKLRASLASAERTAASARKAERLTEDRLDAELDRDARRADREGAS